ncbi:hypothetical protein PISL3812_09253 [Talaromyces islandicus]|uniref:Inner membrane assembly complex subunit 17 n=1 Tax=Talaromyces islandicus TaxID=28573 RepID=A0A0U1M9B7_TALIS|nr:hypothetical protein PISL3812_09253 [Talaromyces islandicus]
MTLRSTALRVTAGLRPASRVFFTRRTFTSSASRLEQQTQNTNSFKEGMSAFRPFGRPFAKVFLGAIFAYQLIYWTWMKLEIWEKKLLKNEELQALEKKAKELAASPKK